MRPRWRRYAAWPILYPLAVAVLAGWWIVERLDAWAGTELFDELE